MSNKTNAAIIRVSSELLIEFLQFKGGTLHRICQNAAQWRPDEFMVVVEHPDLPEVEEGYTLMEIKPVYLRVYDETGHLLELTRISPEHRALDEEDEDTIG